MMFNTKNEMSFRPKGEVFVMKKGKLTLISFRTKKLTLLRAPYVSDCIDYKAISMVGQDMCLHKCAFKKYRNTNEAIPYEISLPETDDRIISYAENANPFGDDCESFCKRKDCNLIEYETYEFSSYEIFGTGVGLVLPTNEDLLITYSPQMSLDEFYAFIASILSLWLGFSVIDGFNYAYPVMKLAMKC